MSFEKQKGKSETGLPPPTAEESQLTGLSVEEKRLQIENLRRQQEFQALLQSIATGQGGLFDEAATAGIAAGSADIDVATREGLGLLREELAPSLGLRSTDSPILDRGNLLARKGVEAKGGLERTLRAQALTNRLALLSASAGTGLGLAGIGAGNTGLAALGQIRAAQGTRTSEGQTFGLDLAGLARGAGASFMTGGVG
jgi:hypothetical protein